MSLHVVRAFVRLREMVAANKELSKKLDELERRVSHHDGPKGPATVLKSGGLRTRVDIGWLPHLIALDHGVQDQQKFVHASHERNLLHLAVAQ